MATYNEVNGRPLSVALIALFLTQNVILVAMAGWVQIFYTPNCDDWYDYEQTNASNPATKETEDAVECHRLQNLALILFIQAATFTVFGTSILLVVCCDKTCDHQRAYGKRTCAWVVASVFPSIFLVLLLAQTWNPYPATRYVLVPYSVCVCAQFVLYCYGLSKNRTLPYTTANKEEV